MTDLTPAEIEAGTVAAAQAIWGDEAYGDLIPREFMPNVALIATEAALRAVLPDHDARVRAEMAENVVAALIGEETKPHGMISVAEAVEIAREVTGAPPDDEEVDTPEAEFDQRWAAAEPVRVVGTRPPTWWRWVDPPPDPLALIAAVLADLERLGANDVSWNEFTSGEHVVDCWRWHIRCLAARIRATLTGEDTTDDR